MLGICLEDWRINTCFKLFIKLKNECEGNFLLNERPLMCSFSITIAFWVSFPTLPALSTANGTFDHVQMVSLIAQLTIISVTCSINLLRQRLHRALLTAQVYC